MSRKKTLKGIVFYGPPDQDKTSANSPVMFYVFETGRTISGDEITKDLKGQCWLLLDAMSGKTPDVSDVSDPTSFAGFMSVFEPAAFVGVEKKTRKTIIREAKIRASSLLVLAEPSKLKKGRQAININELRKAPLPKSKKAGGAIYATTKFLSPIYEKAGADAVLIPYQAFIHEGVKSGVLGGFPTDEKQLLPSGRNAFIFLTGPDAQDIEFGHAFFTTARKDGFSALKRIASQVYSSSIEQLLQGLAQSARLYKFLSSTDSLEDIATIIDAETVNAIWQNSESSLIKAAFINERLIQDQIPEINLLAGASVITALFLLGSLTGFGLEWNKKRSLEKQIASLTSEITASKQELDQIISNKGANLLAGLESDWVSAEKLAATTRPVGFNLSYFQLTPKEYKVVYSPSPGEFVSPGASLIAVEQALPSLKEKYKDCNVINQQTPQRGDHEISITCQAMDNTGLRSLLGFGA